MNKMIRKIRLFFYLLPRTLSVFFSRSVTRHYPFHDPEIPERYRGRVNINENNCVGCSLCVLDCPASALELEKESKSQFRLLHYQDRCTYCGQCEDSCRFNAIFMDNHYIKPAFDRDDFFVVLVNRKEV